MNHQFEVEKNLERSDPTPELKPRAKMDQIKSQQDSQAKPLFRASSTQIVEGKKKRNRCNQYLSSLDSFGSIAAFKIGGDDTYKTTAGTFFSVLLFASILASFVFYLAQYLDTTQPNVTVTNLAGSEYPMLNLTSYGFFFSVFFQFGQATSNIDEMNARYFDMKGFQVSQTKGKASVFEEFWIRNCREVNRNKRTGTGEIILGNLNRATGKDSSCNYDPPNGIYTNGTFGDPTFSYIELQIGTCNRTLYPECENGQGGALFSKLGGIPENRTAEQETNSLDKKFREIKLYLSFVEAAVEVGDFNSPIKYVMNSNYWTVPHTGITKVKEFYLQPIEIQSETGYVTASTNSTDSIVFDKLVEYTIPRSASAKVSIKKADGQSVDQNDPYVIIRFLSSNRKTTVVRQYNKLLDVFANVGGLSDVIVVAIAIAYSWWNENKKEQEILNKAIIESDIAQDKQKDEFKLRDILKIHYCPCCVKKPRKEFYEQCSESFESRMDIIAILRTLHDMKTLKAAVLQPYQIKLIAYNKISRDNTQGMTEEAQEMPLNIALKMLIDGVNQSEIGKRIDNYLKQNLDYDQIEKLVNQYESAEDQKEGKGLLEDRNLKQLHELKSSLALPMGSFAVSEDQTEHNENQQISKELNYAKSNRLQVAKPQSQVVSNAGVFDGEDEQQDDKVIILKSPIGKMKKKKL